MSEKMEFKEADWKSPSDLPGQGFTLPKHVSVEWRQHMSPKHPNKFAAMVSITSDGKTKCIGHVEIHFSSEACGEVGISIDALCPKGDIDEYGLQTAIAQQIQLTLEVFVDHFKNLKNLHSITFLQAAIQGKRQVKILNDLHKRGGILDNLGFSIHTYNKEKGRSADVTIWYRGACCVEYL